jgi:hypothetical protein|tara:strand:+ start:620 stop:835 length:216 start_codon:yes stop_codon:yes gene_type:complete
VLPPLKSPDTLTPLPSLTFFLDLSSAFVGISLELTGSYNPHAGKINIINNNKILKKDERKLLDDISDFFCI